MKRWQDRRLWALFANSAYALSSFLLGWLLLLQGNNTVYGAFAFYLVLQAFAYSLSNALFGAPLLIASRHGEVSPGTVRPMLALAFLLALLFAAVQGVVLWLQGVAADAVVLLLCSSVLLQLRWFCRCVQQNDAPAQVIAADLSFSLTALAGAALIWWLQWVTISSSGLILMVAAIAGLWPCRRLLQAAVQARSDWRLCRHGYQQQGKPALFGVLTAELTANSHQYLIVLLQGAAAFAPVAAAGLFLRPMTLVQSSLAQIERPRLARAAAAADGATLRALWRSFIWLNLLAFVLNLLVLLLLLWLAPTWLWPEQSSWSSFIACVGFIAAAALLRSIRSPACTLLQAVDQFHYLARVTWRASLVTLPLVLLGLYCGGLWGALFAMLLGECAVAIPAIRRCRRVLAQY